MIIKFIKKQKISVIFSIIAVIFAISLSLISELPRINQKRNFVDNGRNEPYAKGVPLDEMKLWIYENRYIYSRAQIQAEYINLIKDIPLPCDVHYYAQKEDAEPVLTLKKGTAAHITDGDLGLIDWNGAGYGLLCWPDYQKGWRYGRPFTDDDPIQPSDTAEAYYVKTAELDKVAKTYYLENSGYYASSRFKSSQELVREIDWMLYDAGAFCSPDLP